MEANWRTDVWRLTAWLCFRVKVECLPLLNGHSSGPVTPNGNWRKRQRDTAEDGPGDGAGSAHKKKKKKKTKKLEDGTTEGTNLAKVDGRNKTSETKKALKKKKKTRLSVANSHAASTKASAAPHKPSAPKKMAAAKTSKAKAPSSDSSSSDEETVRQQKPTAAPKGPQKPKNPQPSSSSSSSSETDSPSAVAPSSSGPKAPPVAPQSADGASSNREPPHSAAPEPRIQDDEEEEIQLVIRRPQQPFLNIPRRGPGRGARDGPGAERPGWRGQRDAQSCTNGTTTPSVQTDVLTNKSVVFQNEAEQAPLKDYNSMPLLAAPPQVGQKIAFKVRLLALMLMEEGCLMQPDADGNPSARIGSRRVFPDPVASSTVLLMSVRRSCGMMANNKAVLIR
ncbi:PREDICTED: coilin [Cyprinodon variegatus]|uniref:coilin n=1 Tax=Cyprinodon variegatus TaxID=28743 RepID=UPI00074299B2|nr:PREDICTED: coilin [Cyprinodon variegatus]